MADNKNSVNRGIGRSDEEQLRRLPAAPGGASEPSPRTKEVPLSATKPGRPHDQSRAKHGRTRAEKRAESPPHSETTIRGDTYESNDETGHVTHNNR